MIKTVTAILALLVLSACADTIFIRTETQLTAVFKIKDANSVSLYSSANGFAEIKALKDKDRWTAAMPYSAEMRYFLTVDGKTYLPDCAMKEMDDFGGSLCVYEED